MHAADPTSIAGKVFATRGRYDHVVVGAGEAGIAAARAAAAAGERTLLVDEHPLDAPTELIAQHAQRQRQVFVHELTGRCA